MPNDRDEELEKLNATFGSVKGFGFTADMKMSDATFQAVGHSLSQQKIGAMYVRSSPDSEPRPMPLGRKNAAGSFGPELGSLFLNFAVPSFALFAAGFLAEAGKDTYVWIKSKIAVDQVRERDNFYIQYHFRIGTVSIVDKPKQSTKTRHDEFLTALQKIEAELSEDEKMDRLTVELEFDDERSEYVKATLLRDDGGNLKTPLRDFDL